MPLFLDKHRKNGCFGPKSCWSLPACCLYKFLIVISLLHYSNITLMKQMYDQKTQSIRKRHTCLYMVKCRKKREETILLVWSHTHRIGSGTLDLISSLVTSDPVGMSWLLMSGKLWGLNASSVIKWELGLLEDEGRLYEVVYNNKYHWPTFIQLQQI